MNKILEFYLVATANKSAKEELSSILGGRQFSESSDDQLIKIGNVAKRLGFDITLKEVRDYLNPAKHELDNADLESVAGGNKVVNCSGEGSGCNGHSSGFVIDSDDNVTT